MAGDDVQSLLAGLLDISRNLVGARDLRLPARRLLDLALSLTDFVEGHIYLHDRPREALVPLVWRVPGTSARPNEVCLGADSPTARAAKAQQPRMEANGVRVEVGEGKPLSTIALPLMAGGHVVGVLSLSAKRPCYVTAQVVDFLTLAANQMAGAIENARLYEEAVSARGQARAIVDACADAIMVVDAQHRVLDANPALERLTGFAIDEILGKQCTYMLDARDQEGCRVCDTYCPMRQPLELPRGEVEATIRTRDGREVWVGITLGEMKDASGGTAGVVHTIRDISDHKAAEQLILANTRRAEEERRRLQAIVDNLPEGVCIAQAPGGELLLANRKAAELLGDPTSLLAGADAAPAACRLLTPDNQPIPLDELPLTRSLRGEHCSGVQVGVQRPHGRVSTLLVNSAPLYGADGTITGAVAAFQDISQLKEVEWMKDDFLAMASHELRTPITSIKGYAQMLVRRLGRREDHAEDLSALLVIVKQIDRLIMLVNQMLDVARLRKEGLELTLGRFDLVGLATEVVERTQATTERHEIVLAAERPVWVYADNNRIEQVLVNLLANAVKYSPEGGRVTLRVGADAERAVVAVEDTGIGIPADRLDRIFERFYQAHADLSYRCGGMGLGLHVSREIVVRHGGTMWVESVEGVGSTFHFSLPLVARRRREVRAKGGV